MAALAAKQPYELLGCLEDEILAHYPKNYFPLPDADGRPVYIEWTGHIDIECMFMITGEHRYTRKRDPGSASCEAGERRPSLR